MSSSSVHIIRPGSHESKEITGGQLVAACRHHLAVVTSERNGRTGITEYNVSPLGVEVKKMHELNFGVESVACGAEHLLVLAQDGRVLSCGSNEHGQLGRSVPQEGTFDLNLAPVAALPTEGVASIACGYFCSFFVTVGGDLWAWGDNRYGQLGLASSSHSESISEPVMVSVSPSFKVRQVSSGFAHTWVLSQHRDQLASTGINQHGQLGTGDRVSIDGGWNILQSTVPIESVSCGNWVTLLLTLPGDIFQAGIGPTPLREPTNEREGTETLSISEQSNAEDDMDALPLLTILGVPPSTTTAALQCVPPRRVPVPDDGGDDVEISDISCGGMFCGAIDDKGRLFGDCCEVTAQLGTNDNCNLAVRLSGVLGGCFGQVIAHRSPALAKPPRGTGKSRPFLLASLPSATYEYFAKSSAEVYVMLLRMRLAIPAREGKCPLMKAPAALRDLHYSSSPVMTLVESLRLEGRLPWNDMATHRVHARFSGYEMKFVYSEVKEYWHPKEEPFNCCPTKETFDCCQFYSDTNDTFCDAWSCPQSTGRGPWLCTFPGNGSSSDDMTWIQIGHKDEVTRDLAVASFGGAIILLTLLWRFNRILQRVFLKIFGKCIYGARRRLEALYVRLSRSRLGALLRTLKRSAILIWECGGYDDEDSDQADIGQSLEQATQGEGPGRQSKERRSGSRKELNFADGVEDGESPTAAPSAARDLSPLIEPPSPSMMNRIREVTAKSYSKQGRWQPLDGDNQDGRMPKNPHTAALERATMNPARIVPLDGYNNASRKTTPMPPPSRPITISTAHTSRPQTKFGAEGLLFRSHSRGFPGKKFDRKGSLPGNREQQEGRWSSEMANEEFGVFEYSPTNATSRLEDVSKRARQSEQLIREQRRMRNNETMNGRMRAEVAVDNKFYRSNPGVVVLGGPNIMAANSTISRFNGFSKWTTRRGRHKWKDYGADSVRRDIEKRSKAFSQLQQQRVREAREATKAPSVNLMEIQEERQMVKSLVDDVVPTEEKQADFRDRMKKREVFAAKRKKRHDEALEEYKTFIVNLAKECEAEVESESEKLLRSMGEQDSEVAVKLDIMESESEQEEAVLSAKSSEWIDEVLSFIESMIVDRKKSIEQFGEALEAIESSKRKKCIDERLRALAEELLLAAHEDQGTIERIITDLSDDANSILADNRRQHSELVLRLATSKCNGQKVALTERWERGRHKWRICRHERALNNALSRIASSEFQDPPEIVKILNVIKISQTEKLEQRLAIVSQVRDLPVYNMTSAVAEAALTELEALHEEAEKFRIVHSGDLDAARRNTACLGDKLLEELIAEVDAIDCHPSWGTVSIVDIR
ncbi:hypothetical protein FOL47_008292 [Perkinsus chesapeaki]|uniref:DUF4455 domain-containing protein n=1 Tax=Perkinsus chesapeaki TaxID=330153 RepID=A0A7J6LF80_PERCH|nr:hypothetical protein FOL47_008292 [Perkinsus chesapeaki]